MKAAIATAYGGPDVLQIRDVPAPEPTRNGILVKVRAIGLNFADIFARSGVYPGTPKPPFIPGLEFSGDVVTVGSSVTRHRPGERVMGYCRFGSHAEFVTLGENFAVTMPATMSYEDAAAFFATGMTAYHGLIRLANLRKGERLLVHAAAGGVGLATLQIGRHLGAEIFATAGSDAKLELARSYGANHTFNYVKEDFARETLLLTGDEGVDVVMDSVGGDVFRKGWKILAQMGRYILLGISAANGRGALNYVRVARAVLAMPPVFPHTLIAANKSLFGFNLGTLKRTDPYFLQAAAELIQLYNIGALKSVVGKTFPFDQVVDAHKYLQSRQSVGKVVICFDRGPA